MVSVHHRIVALALVALSPLVARADDSSGHSNWSGIYGGLAIGAMNGKVSPDTSVLESAYFFPEDAAQLNPLLQAGLEGTNISGSLLFGYNVQSDNIVYGIDADLTLARFSETESFGPTAYGTAPASSFESTTTAKSNGSFSVRPRIGVARDNFLFFAGLGPSLTYLEMTHNYSDNHGIGNSSTFREKKVALGASLNVGAEYALAPQWSLRADYTFSYYPEVFSGTRILNSGDTDPDFSYGGDFQSQNFRIGLLRRF